MHRKWGFTQTEQRMMNISLVHFHFPRENFNKEKCYPMSALSGKVLLVFCILFAPECPRARTLAGIYLALKQNFGFKVVCTGVSSREDTPAHTTTNAENIYKCINKEKRVEKRMMQTMLQIFALCQSKAENI
jgi:hypothetical protein